MIYVENYGPIVKAMMQDTNLHVTAKAIYLYMCSFEDNSQCCFHTRPKMVYDLGINDITLKKYLNQLTENGYIKTQKRMVKSRYRNIYTILDSKL